MVTVPCRGHTRYLYQPLSLGQNHKAISSLTQGTCGRKPKTVLWGYIDIYAIITDHPEESLDNTWAEGLEQRQHWEEGLWGTVAIVWWKGHVRSQPFGGGLHAACSLCLLTASAFCFWGGPFSLPVPLSIKWINYQAFNFCQTLSLHPELLLSGKGK